MDIRPIHTDADYEAALRRIDEIFEAEEGTPEDDELEILSAVVASYERKHYPPPKARPVDVLRFMMEQGDRTQADLAELLGSRPRASEILNEKRELTLEQIRLISARWDIPAGALVGELAPA